MKLFRAAREWQHARRRRPHRERRFRKGMIVQCPDCGCVAVLTRYAGHCDRCDGPLKDTGHQALELRKHPVTGETEAIVAEGLLTRLGV